MSLSLVIVVAVVIVGLVLWKLQPVRLSKKQVDKLASTPEGTDMLAEMILLRGELQTRRRRELFWRVVGFACIAVVLWLVLTVKDTQDQTAANRKDSRAAFCGSFDDIGDAAKAGTDGLVGTLTDPAIVPDPERLRAFAERAQTNADAAVDAAIVKARERNGFSADCTQIGLPPTTTTQPGG